SIRRTPSGRNKIRGRLAGGLGLAELAPDAALHERVDERILAGAHLGLEERRDEERMLVELDGADLVLVVDGGDTEVAALDEAAETPVQAEAAVVLFDRFRNAVDAAQPGSIDEADTRLDAGEGAS